MTAADHGRIRVLHVDDEPGFADTVAAHLGRASEALTVETETSPGAALDRLDDGFDCVVSDYRMPEMDGVELLEAVRADHEDLPFILFTGEGSEAVASDAVSAGVTDYLRKGGGPERYELLANRVEHAVEKRRAEASYREMFEKATDGILLHDPETGEIRDANRRMCEMLGYSRDELCSLRVEDFSADDPSYTQAEAERRIRRAATEGPQVFEWVNVTAEGERLPVEVHLAHATVGGRDQVLATVRDVSERAETQRKLEAIVENTDQAIYIKDREGRYELMNEAGAALFGLDPEEVRGLRDEDLFDPGAAARIREIDEEIMASGEPYAYEGEVTIDGERRVFSNAKVPYVSATGETVGVVGISTDVTERERRRRELREERDRASALFENSTDCVVYREFEGGTSIVRDVNLAFEETFGYDADDVVGRPLNEVVVPADRTAEAAALSERARDGEQLDVEVRRETAEGVRDFLLRSVPLRPGESGEKGYAVYTDITERKCREEELRRYETIIEATGDPVYVLDADGRFTFVNERFEEMTGYDADDLLGEHVTAVGVESDVAAGEALIRRLLGDTGRTRSTLEMELVTVDGDRVPTETHVALLPFVDGEFQGTVGVVRDITERKARERALERQNERLEEFASVVSHDLRNPLNVAQASLDLLRETGDDEHVGRLDRALSRIEGIIEDVLTLARHGRSVDEPEVVESDEVVERAWRSVETLDADLDSDLRRPLRADASRLQQLLENLFANAVEHGSADGVVRVGPLDGDGDEDGGVSLRGFYVEDDGPGIPEGERERVLESGYSTTDDGTGLGLSIAAEIVDAHGWDLAVTTGDDGGARVEVTGVTFEE
jgi:PAS domain S-box-containing protein